MLSCRFPAPDKASKMGKLDVSSFPQINKTSHQQSEVDEVKAWTSRSVQMCGVGFLHAFLCTDLYFHSLQSLASMLFDALVTLREQIMDECNEGYHAYHIFK